MTVWVIGCNGMLGSQVCRTFSENKVDFLGTDSDVSILDYTALEGFAAGKKISFIVNCAAYTAVDKAESETEKARALNADGPRNIARLAKKLGVPFLHISTDYVFDGNASSPITEDTPIKPLGVYGVTKAEGEKAIAEETDDFYILRTAWLYGWSGKNFVYTMIRAMNTHDSVKVVNDQKGTPTNCVTLANVILRIIGKRAEGESVPNGIYHVTDLGEITWFDFAKEIFAQGVERGLVTNRDCAVNPCTTEEYPIPAKRPAYSVLDKTKVQRALGIKLPAWRESLAGFLRSESFDNERIR